MLDIMPQRSRQQVVPKSRQLPASVHGVTRSQSKASLPESHQMTSKAFVNVLKTGTV